MSVSRVLSRVSRTIPRSSLLLSSSPQKHYMSILANQSNSLLYETPSKLVPRQVSLFHHSAINPSVFQRFGMSSSASPEPSQKDHGSTGENSGVSTNGESVKADAKVSAQPEDSGSGEGDGANQMKESDSEGEGDLSMDDLVKLVAEKEELLKLKHKEIEKMQDKVLRSYAEMENVMDRTRREAESTKKFAIQNFAKNLLDVADNLGRASSVVKESFLKIDASKDSTGAVPLLKTLLEGVEMTEKQLAEVFKKFGVEKFDPTNEPFDPHRHNAIFQVPDSTKDPGTVAMVLKSGYTLYDRVIRPAEVGVAQAVETEEDAGK
ncbi:grpE protein homolog 2, mitochondrial isoform X2 [Ziziphus jujuba]|uniref:GrpE protein homolog n=1 Tax=Ziziphus jujuba TaxID=326968 RepID=A0A6P3YV01_ZIZJJ|nr:grpE protein homolog 2, mitochondrial isoform X2 [Ziziphus jujuba]